MKMCLIELWQMSLSQQHLFYLEIKGQNEDELVASNNFCIFSWIRVPTFPFFIKSKNLSLNREGKVAQCYWWNIFQLLTQVFSDWLLAWSIINFVLAIVVRGIQYESNKISPSSEEYYRNRTQKSSFSP